MVHFFINLTVLFFLLIGGALYAQNNTLQIVNVAGPKSTPTVMPTATPTPTPTPALPAHLDIPKLAISANVEAIALGDDGKMAVPENPANVGWFSLNPRPGMQGNVIIDGHLDQVTGAPAIFYHLSELEPGDNLIVTTMDNAKYSYRVVRKQIYPYDEVPIEEVLGKTNEYNLNLITCNGIWDQQNHNYLSRVVIYTELIGP